jgi:hypothetical protein
MIPVMVVISPILILILPFVASSVITGMGTMIPVIMVIPVSSGAVNIASVRHDITAAQSDHYQAYNQYQFLHDPSSRKTVDLPKMYTDRTGFPTALCPAIFLRAPFTAPTF